MISPALKTAVIRLVVGIVILDAVAITTYYLADIPTRAPSVRRTFFAAWMILTLAIVLPGLHNVRTARARRLRR